MDRIDNGKYVDRPISRDDFNFKFSMLNLHDYTVGRMRFNAALSNTLMIIRFTSSCSFRIS